MKNAQRIQLDFSSVTHSRKDKAMSHWFLCLHVLGFNENEKHSTQGPLQKMGGAVTLSNAASFLSAILKEGPDLSSTTG